MIRRYCISIFGLLLAACSSVQPMILGTPPVQHVTAGEAVRLDMNRFCEPGEGRRLVVAPGEGYEATVDSASMEMALKISEQHVGLVDLPLQVRGTSGTVEAQSVMTVAASRRARHHFSYRPDGPVTRAVVAGSFNDWNQERTILRDPDGDGVYEADGWLEAGTYLYKFVVDGKWIPDPSNPEKSEDGFGGYNSVLRVAGPAAGNPPALYAARRTNEAVEIAVVKGVGEVTAVSSIVQAHDGSSRPAPYTMTGDRISVPIGAQPAGAILRVIAADADGRVSNSVRVPISPTTGGWEDEVLYFAFTDRFVNGDPSNDRRAPDSGVLYPADYHGGDLAGIRKMIENGYFDSIGVTTIWVSPLNRNPDHAYKEYLPPYRLYTGYHGYWPVSATEVDPRFGTPQDLKSLVAAAHRRGMKVMADMVLNHVHEEHPFFREHPEWFSPLTLPDGTRNLRRWDEHSYTTWFDVFLPDIDFSNPAATQAMLENTEWWIREYDLDGIRLDAVKHIHSSFWKKLRVHLHNTIERERGRPLYLVGETFRDRVGIMAFVGPAMLDGQFDFPLYDTLKSVFAQDNSTFEDLEGSLASSERIYGKESLMSPLVGNHDKVRFTAYADRDLPDPSEPDEEEVGWLRPPMVNDPTSYDRLAMAFAFLFAVDGVPMVYYGDEFGLSGAADPDNRRDMRFGGDLSDDERRMLGRFALLTKIRQEHAALRRGSRRALLVEKDRYAFVRAFLEDRVVAVFNKTDAASSVVLPVAPEIADGECVNLLDGRACVVRDGRLTIELPARSAALIVPRSLARTVGEPEATAVVTRPQFSSVGMAGTFNNWNTADQTTHLAMDPSTGAWEGIRVFHEGEWQFKFVMNGGWTVHRGLSPAGKLEQPGSDIPLKIPRTGFYRVSLNLEQGTWSVAAAPPQQAIADVAVAPEYLLGREISLDASISQSRPGQAIREYRWTQKSGDEFPLELPAPSAAPRLVVRPSRPGLYHLRLEVNDGAPGMGKDLLLNIREAFQVLIDGEDRAREMSIGAEGLHRLLLPVQSGRSLSARVMRNFDQADILGAPGDAIARGSATAEIELVRGGAPIRIEPDRTGLIEILYSPRLEDLVIRNSRAARLLFDPASVPAGAPVEQVSVAGTFNNWSATANPMDRLPDGKFEAILDLPEGLYQYKLVLNGKTWIADPGAEQRLAVADGFGGSNSGVLIGERGEDYGSATAGDILASALRHDPNDPAYFVAVSREVADVRIRIREGDATSVLLVRRNADDSLLRIEMKKLMTRMGFDWYGADLPASGGAADYGFEIMDGDYLYTYRAGNAVASQPLTVTNPWFRRELKVAFATPDWAKNVIWYQIMLDRWRNDDASNDPDSAVPWRWDWFKPVTPGESRAFYGGQGIWHRLYGGDLAGLISSLDYLEDLGVTGIYLNPVFEAPGHHKYNATDYRHIDDNFGTRGDVQERWKVETSDSRTWELTPTDRLFVEFLRLAHARGFKVIIDGVFNHSGTEFWAFQDVVKNGRNSPYKDWYVIKEWDVAPEFPGGPTFRYEGWAGFSGLPEYAENDRGLLPGIRNHIFDITRHWQDPNGDGDPSDGVDGWRLDVPENVHERFWRDWRQVVKGVNPEAYITGEIWENAAHRLQGDHYDAVMNYEFQKRVHAFFLGGGTTPAIDAPAFARSMEALLGWYLPQVTLVQQNLLSSHDVDRIASAIHNRAGWKRGRVQDENPRYDTSPPTPNDYAILKRIFTLMMTWPGAPMIYYGDEAGMYGADDPTNRMPMWWQDLMPYDNPAYRIRPDLVAHNKHLVALRNTYSCLRTGRVRFLHAAGDVVVYERWDHDGRVVVAINNGTASSSVRLAEMAGRWVNVGDPSATDYVPGSVSGIGSTRRQVRSKASAARWTAAPGTILEIDVPAGGSVILARVRE